MRIKQQLPGQYFICYENRYWVLNKQKGWVEVFVATSRGLIRALAESQG